METSAKSMAASSADLKSVAEGFSTTSRTVAGNLSDAVSSIQSVSQQQSLSLRALDQHSSAIDQITSHSTTAGERLDRKSTRLNSSHVSISYAVFCLKKKK